jgi:hypothetical protein
MRSCREEFEILYGRTFDRLKQDRRVEKWLAGHGSIPKAREGP